MSDRDFEIGSRKFKLGKIDAFKQFHIVRRIGPILSDMLPAMKDVQKVGMGDNLTESQKLDAFAEIAAPIMTGISKLSDQDADRVLFGLLGSVEVQQPGGNWAKVATDSMLMIQDLELPVLLQIAGRAFAFNLSGFFSGLPQK
jgi:hypothetical protein